MKHLLTMLLITISALTYGQSLHNISELIYRVPIDSLPLCVIKLNETEFYFDEPPIGLKEDWIKNIYILRRDEEVIYDSQRHGTVIIQPNKKYFEQVKMIVKDNSQHKKWVKKLSNIKPIAPSKSE